MKLLKYTVYYPDGNPTALIEGTYSPEEKKAINDYILETDVAVEQVGFVTRNEKGIALDMAGGEFCGNATRCAIYHYLESGQSSAISVSGSPRILTGGILDPYVWADMPIILGKCDDSIEILDENYILVKMHGISHLLIYDESFLQNRESPDFESFLKISAQELFVRYDLYGPDALGAMFIKKDDIGIHLFPVVFVRDINTLFFESACGSGTTAVGLYESCLEGCSRSSTICQPSGDFIAIDVTLENDAFLGAKIMGDVKKTYEGEITL